MTWHRTLGLALIAGAAFLALAAGTASAIQLEYIDPVLLAASEDDTGITKLSAYGTQLQVCHPRGLEVARYASNNQGETWSDSLIESPTQIKQPCLTSYNEAGDAGVGWRKDAGGGNLQPTATISTDGGVTWTTSTISTVTGSAPILAGRAGTGWVALVHEGNTAKSARSTDGETWDAATTLATSVFVEDVEWDGAGAHYLVMRGASGGPVQLYKSIDELATASTLITVDFTGIAEVHGDVSMYDDTRGAFCAVPQNKFVSNSAGTVRVTLDAWASTVADSFSMRGGSQIRNGDDACAVHAARDFFCLIYPKEGSTADKRDLFLATSVDNGTSWQATKIFTSTGPNLQAAGVSMGGTATSCSYSYMVGDSTSAPHEVWVGTVRELVPVPPGEGGVENAQGGAVDLVGVSTNWDPHDPRVVVRDRNLGLQPQYVRVFNETLSQLYETQICKYPDLSWEAPSDAERGITYTRSGKVVFTCLSTPTFKTVLFQGQGDGTWIAERGDGTVQLSTELRFAPLCARASDEVVTLDKSSAGVGKVVWADLIQFVIQGSNTHNALSICLDQGPNGWVAYTGGGGTEIRDKVGGNLVVPKLVSVYESIAIHNDTVVAGKDGVVHVYRGITAGQALPTPEVFNAQMVDQQAVKFSKDGRYFLTVGPTNVSVWNATTGNTALASWANGEDIRDADMDVNNNWLYVMTASTVTRHRVYHRTVGEGGSGTTTTPNPPPSGDPFELEDPPLDINVWGPDPDPGEGTLEGAFSSQNLEAVGGWFGTDTALTASMLAGAIIGVLGIGGFLLTRHVFGGVVGSFAGFLVGLGGNLIPLWIPAFVLVLAVAFVVYRMRGS